MTQLSKVARKKLGSFALQSLRVCVVAFQVYTQLKKKNGLIDLMV